MAVVKESEGRETTLARLGDQIGWYSRRGRTNQRAHQIAKVIAIILAALIPLLAGTVEKPIVLGLVGVALIVLQGIEHLFKFHENWISYRSTCEQLKHEKHLYMAKAGPYRDEDRDRLLAERVEDQISREHTRWIASRHKSEQDLKELGQRP